jgi:EAL domain-containing protein (putative c-di-GMP-specific phosphodiesterase class I)
MASRSERDAATINELNRSVARQTDQLRSAARPTRSDDEQEPAAEPRSANVVEHPALRRGAPAPEPRVPEGIEAELVNAVAAGALELSLQPIVSLSRGAAAGFEVHAHLGGDEAPANLRRLPVDIPGVDAGEFERLMVLAAVNAARRQLGDAGKSMPLHVAISGALLAGPLAKVTELFDRYPECAEALVLSVPAALLDHEAHRRGLDRLAAMNVAIAVEDWPSGRGKADRLKGIAFLKLTADRLLDRGRQRRGESAGNALIDAATAAGTVVIATDVRNDEDAVALLDLGIDLMNGERFSGPRRLRPEGNGGPGKVARG